VKALRHLARCAFVEILLFSQLELHGRSSVFRYRVCPVSSRGDLRNMENRGAQSHEAGGITEMMKAVDERVTWPVVLVAHAYAGAVTAATRDKKVKALADVAALAPDEGETVADVF
jgi:hypothetical protein